MQRNGWPHFRSNGGPEPPLQPVTPMLTGVPTASCCGPPLRITNGLIAAINDRLAAAVPEKGGAILAAGGLLHLLIEDTSGRYTDSSWDISAQLTKVVGEAESAGHGTLAGSVHTHPSGFPDSSGADIATTREALDLNPHLAGLVIAVVSEGAPRERDLSVGARHRMSLHLLRRTPRRLCTVCGVRWFPQPGILLRASRSRR